MEEYAEQSTDLQRSSLLVTPTELKKGLSLIVTWSPSKRQDPQGSLSAPTYSSQTLSSVMAYYPWMCTNAQKREQTYTFKCLLAPWLHNHIRVMLL